MKIGVGITGSIAAYRSPDFIKELIAQGHEARALLTASGSEFVSRRVLETVSLQPVLSEDPFAKDHASTDHISSARWADLFVIYAASANFIARYAAGMADDFLTLQLIATHAPVIIVPAMNPAMWEHPATQANVKTLLGRGVQFVGPISGIVTCGEEGLGHIANHADILKAVKEHKEKTHAAEGGLKNKKILISAGPMRTSIDPVRYLQNRSSGKMGLELAREAKRQGAQVQVILGPVESEIKKAFSEFEVENYHAASDYQEKLLKNFPHCDVFISAAAVLDFQVDTFEEKMSRSTLKNTAVLELPIHPVPDFVQKAASEKAHHQRVIAFAAETGTNEEILKRARSKLVKKGVDMVIVNPVREGVGPEADQNEAWILTADQADLHLKPASKQSIARQIVHTLIH